LLTSADDRLVDRPRPVDQPNVTEDVDGTSLSSTVFHVSGRWGRRTARSTWPGNWAVTMTLVDDGRDWWRWMLMSTVHTVDALLLDDDGWWWGWLLGVTTEAAYRWS